MYSYLIKKIKENELSRLKTLVQTLENFNTDELKFISKSFTMKDIPNMETGDSLVIYYFEIKENLTKDEMAGFGTDLKNEGRRYAKQNITGTENERVLYVGSSHQFGRRFKEHCGFGYKGTYSLQMNHWINHDRLITVYYALLDSSLEYILQTLEDATYDELKPLFGKKGKK